MSPSQYARQNFINGLAQADNNLAQDGLTQEKLPLDLITEAKQHQENKARQAVIAQKQAEPIVLNDAGDYFATRKEAVDYAQKNELTDSHNVMPHYASFVLSGKSIKSGDVSDLLKARVASSAASPSPVQAQAVIPPPVIHPLAGLTVAGLQEQMLAPKQTVKPQAIKEDDDLLTAIAKLGGLNSDHAKQEGIDTASLNHRAKVFGKSNVFTKNGRDYDDMVESLSGHGDEISGHGFDIKDKNDLVDQVSRAINHGEKIYTPRGSELHAERELSAEQADRFEQEQAKQAESGNASQAEKEQAHNALPKQEQGSTGGLKSKNVSVHRSNDYLETGRDLKSNKNGIIPMQDVGNDSRSLMLADKLAALFKGTYNNDTGKYGFEKIISINPKNDSAVVIDNDGQLKTFSAADNGDRWHYMAHVMPSQNKDLRYSKRQTTGKISSLTNLLSIALSRRDGNKAFTDIGEVTSEVAEKTKKATGIDVSGFVHAVDESAIRHIFEKHGNEKSEALRGQVAVTNEDIESIADVLMSPDNIEQGKKNNTIELSKRIGNEVFVVQEIRVGRKKLAIVTMWKKPLAAHDAPLKESPAETSKTDDKQASSVGSISENKSQAKENLATALRTQLDRVFGQGWFTRLMATGKVKVIDSAEADRIINGGELFSFKPRIIDHNDDKSQILVDTGKGEKWFNTDKLGIERDWVGINADSDDLPELLVTTKKRKKVYEDDNVNSASYEIDNDGNAIVYHATSKANANKILKSGKFQAGSFFEPNANTTLKHVTGRIKNPVILKVKIKKYLLGSAAAGAEIYVDDAVAFTPFDVNKPFFFESEIDAFYSKNGKVQAFYNPANDTTYFVADNIDQRADLRKLMLHEIGVHALQLGKDNAEFKAILQQVKNLTEQPNPSKAVRAAIKAAIDAKTPADLFLEEVAGYLVEHHADLNVSQKIIAWFKKAVRAIGKALPSLERQKFFQWANALNEADIITLASAALRNAPDSLLFGGDVEGVIRNSEISLRYSLRARPSPSETIKAYKLFRVKKSRPGELFPLFVPMGDDASVPIGVWEDAEFGQQITDKSGKTGVKSKIGQLALRPGFHMGDSPASFHIGGDKGVGNKPTTRPDDQVWAEVEVPADIDWQKEANSRADRSKAGNIIPRTAHITDQLPVDGFYRYKTNLGFNY